jgi:hypothetical protein
VDHDYGHWAATAVKNGLMVIEDSRADMIVSEFTCMVSLNNRTAQCHECRW